MAIEPTLYIFMRKDLPDMNPGKAMAQAAHAQADFDHWAHGQLVRAASLRKYEYNDQEQLQTIANADAIIHWRDGRNFGRTLVLQADSSNYEFDGTRPYEVIDPTYPYRNWYGDAFTMNTVTCWWMFIHSGSSQEELEFVKIFPLHP